MVIESQFGKLLLVTSATAVFCFNVMLIKIEKLVFSASPFGLNPSREARLSRDSTMTLCTEVQ